MANDGKGASRVNLNAADESDLMRIEGIDAGRARLILEHRKKHGPFRSWEDFEGIVGIGPALTAKARSAATLGGADGEPQTDVSFNIEDLAGEDAEEMNMDEIEVLSSLARLDLEAALAYEVGADASVDIAELRQHLLRFRDDHLRHVQELNRIIRDRGGTPVEIPANPGEHLLRSLARLTLPFGPVALILSLLNNEQLTNGTYDLAIEFDWDDEVQELLDRNLADEQRHLMWLAEKEEEFAREAGLPAAPA